MATEFKEGQAVYGPKGQEYIYHGTTSGLHVVGPILLSGDEEFEGDPIGVPKIYASPPVEKLAEPVAALREELIKLRAERSALKAEAEAENKNRSEILARLQQHEALVRIDDFLQGKMTCAVTRDDGEIRVRPIDDALAYIDENGRNEGQKLVTLFGTHKSGWDEVKPDLSWHLSEYYGGDGHNRVQVFFYFSEEDARSAAERLIAQEADNIARKYNDYRSDRLAKSASVLGIDLPADFVALRKEIKRAAALSLVSRQEDELAKSRAALAALEVS